MKGHPVAAAIIAFFVVPSVVFFVAKTATAKDGETDEEKKSRELGLQGLSAAIGIGSTIAAYYYCK